MKCALHDLHAFMNASLTKESTADKEHEAGRNDGIYLLQSLAFSFQSSASLALSSFHQLLPSVLLINLAVQLLLYDLGHNRQIPLLIIALLQLTSRRCQIQSLMRPRIIVCLRGGLSCEYPLSAPALQCCRTIAATGEMQVGLCHGSRLTTHSASCSLHSLTAGVVAVRRLA